MADFSVDFVGLCSCDDYCPVMSGLVYVEMDDLLAYVPGRNLQMGLCVHCENYSLISTVEKLLIVLSLEGLGS